jgi:NAD(P)H-hydrate epimerase
VAAGFAPVLPEAMWLPWPETPGGSLAATGFELLSPLLDRVTALAIGPGIGKEEETRDLVCRLIREIDRPLVLDADALTEDAAQALQDRPRDFAPVILTPHAGEFARLRGESSAVISDDHLRELANRLNTTVVLKGPITRISSGTTVYFCPPGGGALARGGSGDLLTGAIGSLLARPGAQPVTAAAQATFWLGFAADRLARTEGAEAIRTSQILDHLAPVLRGD